MLDWRNATSDDRPKLRDFHCADPANVTFDEENGFECHDAPWEFEVQEWIRALNPPVAVPNFIFLGFDEVGLAAVIYFVVYPFDRYCYIPAIGVAHRVSGQGLAGEALDRVHNLMRKYDINHDYLVDALIDKDNTAAHSAFAARGYQEVGMQGRYEKWAQQF